MAYLSLGDGNVHARLSEIETKAKCGNGPLVAFFNAKSSQGGLCGTPLAFKKYCHTRLLSPWERFERLVVCATFGGMQITRRWKTH
jgi:hypothetical protein